MRKVRNGKKPLSIIHAWTGPRCTTEELVEITVYYRMASDSNGLRNQIFGKVAHLVVSERGLAKIDDPVKADSEVRRLLVIPM